MENPSDAELIFLLVQEALKLNTENRFECSETTAIISPRLHCFPAHRTHRTVF
jgi:hypothetical protein